MALDASAIEHLAHAVAARARHPRAVTRRDALGHMAALDAPRAELVEVVGADGAIARARVAAERLAAELQRLFALAVGARNPSGGVLVARAVRGEPEVRSDGHAGREDVARALDEVAPLTRAALHAGALLARPLVGAVSAHAAPQCPSRRGPS
jgi:hypothetical protein